ncbi:Oidioi.mRNA.OKI2018_I69.chr1.g3157.t1.cds [Oikopleura dioica]|uniref:Oidioi.mRNA.OKI2018_I69.chr1.g3157.t1.cds n=1 Tax=Oikopleura dioica TaxID=34765 RepID=A0ABN7SXJ1_OIKDI|nr:Oidioi.mRNA.OKI2018_I69.chr1.g3157.t1.cds [Oikopleura dioica]
MKLFAIFAAAATAQSLGNETRMYGADGAAAGSASAGCQGPVCVAAVEAIEAATAQLHADQDATRAAHEAERQDKQLEQQQIQADFDAAMAQWQNETAEMNERHQLDWQAFGDEWAAINAEWANVDWSY